MTPRTRSRATLRPTAGNGDLDAFVRDLQEPSARLLTVNDAGTATANGQSDPVVISADGRFAAFITTAGDLGPTDTNGLIDLYLSDLQSGTLQLISVNAAGRMRETANRVRPRSARMVASCCS
jgi:hypothetical protein